LSEAAINRARKIYAKERCFHVLLPADRQKYISKIKQILKKEHNGILFLKCFSDQEPRQKVHTNFHQMK